ncbi:MAG: ATP-binding protein [Paludibacteraceae bacterium]|nr:ATP-binding protein [Paludibacteraceae bacterium]
MENQTIIGRKYELQQLNEMFTSGESELAVVYGRRRVGKTFLVKECFRNHFDFITTGVHNKSADVQLAMFDNALDEYSQVKHHMSENWYDAFEQLKTHIRSVEHDGKKIIFIDEIAWLDTKDDDFMGAFESFWNGWCTMRNDVMLIVCASSSSWITKKLFRHKGGLFNRSSRRLYLEPFNLGETEQYLISRGVDWTRFDITETYMIMGGIPFYLKQISPQLTYSQNIDTIFFRDHGLLWDEFNSLYDTLFENSELYIRIVRALQKRRIGLTRSEIISETGSPDNGNIGKLLTDLVDSGFVRAYNYFGRSKKDIMYQLRDYYTMFYFTYIEDHYGRDDHFWTNGMDSISRHIWAGYGFEQVALDHIQQIKRKIGIAGVLSECSSWFYRGEDGRRGAQIDLCIDRNDRVISLCEMKFSLADFQVDNAYDRQLRERMETFRMATKTRKALHNVLVTTYGLKSNKYSQIFQIVVTLDDLFN